MFPVMLSVRDRWCLVVGGGEVALRKIRALLDDGARVRVVAPEVVEPLRELAAGNRIAVEQRPYRPGEVSGYVLVFAATDQREVNRRVFQDAEESGVWVNVADDPELCSFHLPARVRRGPLQLSIASGGEAPFVVRRLRQALECRFDPSWGTWMEAAAGFRAEVQRREPEQNRREKCFDRFFEETVDPGRLAVRVPSSREQAGWLDRPTGGRRDGDEGEVTGFVSLVGGGPGCAGLLTVRGRQRLIEADAVVYDRLAAPALPCDLPARVTLHDVGKSPGHHPVPQEEINKLLVRLAREGKRVVRFKGGDPYVFGRGGEEAEALVAAAVPFEVVPGVTAGIAAPGRMGIPVTHRGESASLTLLTAHEAVEEEGSPARWDLLARDPRATLVAYMGVAALPRVVKRLLAEGMDAGMPAALVERGATSAQRSVVSTLADLPEAVVREGLRPPALIVIGPTVRHAERLDWFRRLPLAGERLVLPPSAWGWARILEAAGAEVVAVPLPLTPAARVVLGALPLTGCLLGTADEVDALDTERSGPGWENRVIAWGMDPEAVVRARERGWARVEEIEERPAGAALVARIAARGGQVTRTC